MNKKRFDMLVEIETELLRSRMENSKQTILQDINRLQVSKSFYEKAISGLKTRGRFHTSCFATLVAITKVTGILNLALAKEADMSIDGGEFSGRFW